MAFKKELVSESVAWFVRVCILVFYFLISLFFFSFSTVVLFLCSCMKKLNTSSFSENQ